MEGKLFDGSRTRLHLRYERGWHTAAQGMGIYDGKAFVLYDTGMCAVYDLDNREASPLDVFPLGSFNEGVPAREYLNHANDCMFSRTHFRGNPIPLLYVTTGTGTGGDADGYFYRCAVEDITRDARGRYTARTVQTISYCPEGIENTPFLQPCWGCPAWLTDPEEGCLYMFSAKYRTKRGCTPEGEHNRYIITKFPLPDPEAGGFVKLTPADILDQFSVQSDVEFTQGGTVCNGRLYYTFGLPKKDYPDIILIFDLKEKRLIAQVENLDGALNEEEIECCAEYRGRLYVNTNGGFGIYEVALPEDFQV